MENQASAQASSFETKSCDTLMKPELSVSLQSFLLLAVLGKGSFAKVVLVRKSDNDRIYAMKMIKKEMICLKKQGAHVKTERNILVMSCALKMLTANRSMLIIPLSSNYGGLSKTNVNYSLYLTTALGENSLGYFRSVVLSRNPSMKYKSECLK